MGQAQRAREFFNSVKGKIFALFLVTFLVAGGLTALNVWTLSAVRERLVLSERYDDLLNNILEARRSEKNVLIYGDAQSLAEGVDYLNRAEAVARDLAPDMARVAGPERPSRLLEVPAGYRAALLDLGAGLRAAPAGGEIAILGRDAEEFVVLAVRDTGKGIPADQLPHIFEPFFTTKDPGKGAGLGLAVSYSIVKRMGGRIAVESPPGGGARFAVFLPKARPAAGAEPGEAGHGA